MRSSLAAAPPTGPVVVTIGFGTAVAMWALGYLGRLPAVLLPSRWLLLLFLACLLGGGLLLGRHGRLGWPHGALAGLVTGLLNLLVLGSFLGGAPGAASSPSVLLWLPGSLLVTASLAAVGAFAGRRWPAKGPRFESWCAAFARVAVGAALLLLGVGGLVTSAGAGLAVADWPNSFGYNMFLYPFARMTGGIYYEHAHRLFGALVGLTTLVLALLLAWREPRAWVRRLGWLAVVMVVVQGILGGLRVTGGFTLSQESAALSPSIALALVHGVFGQVFFATLVTIAVVSSPSWIEAGSSAAVSGRTDRFLAVAVVVALLGQLILGAARRHLSELLLPHVAIGIGVVLPLCVHAGFRAWGLNPNQPGLRRVGLALVAAVFFQVLLGLGAFFVTGFIGEGASSSVEIVITTAHQWFGAVLLGTAVSLACWTYRLREPGVG